MTPLGDRVLDWTLRRLEQAVRNEHDLVIVHDGPALADVGPRVDVRSEPWRVARVTGELTLRDALPEADRLIAVVPASFPPLPLDLAGRTYLGRILDVRAEDVVAALSGSFCEALVDEDVAAAVFGSLDTLREATGRWSLGELVTARQVRSVLVGAELGAARLDRERDTELLARWLLDGAPSFKATSLVRAALEEAQPRTGRWLAWALTDGTLGQLVTAGALAPSAEGAAKTSGFPAVSEADRPALADLVEGALREVWRRSPARGREVLLEAERLARQARLDPTIHRLLRVPLEDALNHHATRAADGHPADDAVIDALKRNLHAADLRDAVGLVGDLCRLARFVRTKAPEGPVGEWFDHARRDVAWADLAFRRARRALDEAPAWLGDAARAVIAAFVADRDARNLAFATKLAAAWPEVAKNRDARQPLGLHQLSRAVIRRLVDDGQRVFLLVLDGCDLASFLELVEPLPADRRIGLARPDVRASALRDDLGAVEALGVAIAPVPTVTSHSRRALFAGEIPGNTALDDTESAAANATADRAAFERNTALADVPRRLFLKGDLGADGAPLVAALKGNTERVVAAVFNGVDDALSSKETTPLPRWTFGSLGGGALDALQTAVDEGWCVLVTADHGHTPYVAPDRKVAPSGLGGRYAAEAVDGSVAYERGPLPRQPLHLLARFGAWIGGQRRGFHGGAGLEEVVVPMAFLGRVRGEQEGRPTPPAWWWADEGLGPEPAPDPRAEAPRARVVEVPLDPRLDALTADEKRVVALVKQNESVRLTVLANLLGKAPVRTSGLVQQLVRRLHDLGVPCVAVESLPDGDKLYRWQGGGDR